MRRWIGIVGVAWVGCVVPREAPLQEAHRAGAGYWPANSRTAVEGAIAAEFEGIEVDLVLTLDGEAVLSHDPFLEPEHCTDHRGEPIAERIRIDEVRLSTLQRAWRCGGEPDEAFPNAEVGAESLLSLDELLLLLEGANAGMRVHLDLKVEEGWTPPAEAWLEPVLDRWYAAELPQSLVVSANTARTLRAFEDHARARGRDLQSLLIFPYAPVGSSETAVGLRVERDHLLGRISYVDRIEEAGADGIAVNWEIAEKGQLHAARVAGYETALWTVNDGRLLERFGRWPVDTLITDYPGAEP